MSSGGKSSKGGGGTTKMPAMPYAPYYGGSLYDQQEWNKYQQGFDKYKKQQSSGKIGKQQSKQPGFEDTLREKYAAKYGEAPERPGAMFDDAMKKNFAQAWGEDAEKSFADLLFNQSKEMVGQEMFGRGLAPGTEINDAALMKAAQNAIIGGHQLQSQKRAESLGLVDRGYQASTLPYMTAVDWATNQAALNQAAKDNQSSKKGNTMAGATELGKAAIYTYGSDVRLKDNIKPVSEGINGLTIYEFNYNWSPVKYRGYIAQEVEKVDPEHVFDNNGIKMVSEKYAPEVIH